LSPSAALLFRQIHERAVANLEAAELPEQLRAHGRREAVARARDVDQPVIFVENRRARRAEVLQRAERWPSVRIERDEFAVDRGLARRNLL
jgi:hypothetical protein